MNISRISNNSPNNNPLDSKSGGAPENCESGDNLPLRIHNLAAPSDSISAAENIVGVHFCHPPGAAGPQRGKIWVQFKIRILLVEVYFLLFPGSGLFNSVFLLISNTSRLFTTMQIRGQVIFGRFTGPPQARLLEVYSRREAPGKIVWGVFPVRSARFFMQRCAFPARSTGFS